MTARVSLEAVTQAERQSTVDAISTAVGAAGGWIDDVHFYSNISVALRCVLPAGRCAGFAQTLRDIGLKLDDAAVRALTEKAAAMPAPDEMLCALQVTFFHNEPDLRRAIPNVPG
jgi:hypothetical protein